MKSFHFILLCLAGWINREQQAVIEYLQEEVRVLKGIHGRRAWKKGSIGCLK